MPSARERRGHLGRPDGRVVLGPAGGVDAAEGGERLGARRRRTRPPRRAAPGSRAAPPSSALDTIMRCTSMVPEATVAAWA